MARKTYLIVKKEDQRLHAPRIIDMVVILNDIPPSDSLSAEKLLEAVDLEYERLRKQYPNREIQETYADEFPELSPEAQYLRTHKLRNVRVSKISRATKK